MNFTIQDVDQVIERTGCSYAEAKDALVKADGDVLDAIILLESNKEVKQNKGFTSFFGNEEKKEEPFSGFFRESERTADDLMDKIKEAIDQGNVAKIAVRDRYGKTITSVSVNAGATIGTLALLTGAAPLAVISALVAKFGLNCQFVIIHPDGTETIL